MSELLSSGRFPDKHKEIWEKSGLLDKIEEEHKGDLSYLYEVMAYYLVNGQKFDTFGRKTLILEKTKIPPGDYNCNGDRRFETIMFPIIRRIYVGSFLETHRNKIFDIFYMLEYYRDTVGTIKEEEWEKLSYSYFNRIDIEAEIISWFCEHYYEEVIRKNVFSRITLIEHSNSFKRPYFRDCNINTFLDRIRKEI